MYVCMYVSMYVSCSACLGLAALMRFSGMLWPALLRFTLLVIADVVLCMHGDRVVVITMTRMHEHKAPGAATMAAPVWFCPFCRDVSNNYLEPGQWVWVDIMMWRGAEITTPLGRTYPPIWVQVREPWCLYAHLRCCNVTTRRWQPFWLPGVDATPEAVLDSLLALM